MDVAKSRFYETIKEVNIGAFPLRPKDERNRALLEEFIQELINARSSENIAKVIPQKGTVVHVPNRVLVGVVKPSRKGYLGKFEDRTAKRYYTGPHFPTTIPLQNLHFFVPYISGKGIRDVYRIIGLRTIKGSEIHPEDKGEKSNDLRLAFELEYNRSLGENYIPINTNGFIMDTFLDTTFDEILNLNK